MSLEACEGYSHLLAALLDFERLYLGRYVDHFDIDTKDTVTHRHIPFAVILMKVAEEWKATHAGLLPSTAKERSEFKVFSHTSWVPLGDSKIVRQPTTSIDLRLQAAVSTRRLSDDEENYKEALASAYKIWSPPRISTII